MDIDIEMEKKQQEEQIFQFLEFLIDTFQKDNINDIIKSIDNFITRKESISITEIKIMKLVITSSIKKKNFSENLKSLKITSDQLVLNFLKSNNRYKIGKSEKKGFIKLFYILRVLIQFNISYQRYCINEYEILGKINNINETIEKLNQFNDPHSIKSLKNLEDLYSIEIARPFTFLSTSKNYITIPIFSIYESSHSLVNISHVIKLLFNVVRSKYMKLSSLINTNTTTTTTPVPTPIPTTATTATTATTTTTTATATATTTIPIATSTTIPTATSTTVPTNVHLFTTIFKSPLTFDIMDQVDKMIKIYPSLENGLLLIKEIVKLNISDFRSKIEIIKRNAVKSISRDTILKDGELILKSELFSKYLQLRLLLEFNCLYQRKFIKDTKIFKTESSGNKSFIMNDLSTFHNSIPVYFDNFINSTECPLVGEKKKKVTNDYSLTLDNGTSFTCKPFKISQSMEISSTIVSLYNQVYQLAQKYKFVKTNQTTTPTAPIAPTVPTTQTKTTPTAPIAPTVPTTQTKTTPTPTPTPKQVPSLESISTSGAASKQTEMNSIINSLNSLSISKPKYIDIFKTIFKTDNLNNIKIEIDKMILQFPKYNIQMVKDLIIENESILKLKIEKIRDIAALEFSTLYGVKDKLILFNNNLFIDFTALKVMIEFSFIYTRWLLKSFLSNFESTSSSSFKISAKEKQSLYDRLSNLNMTVLFRETISKELSTFRKISNNFSFTLNSHKYLVPYLKFSDDQDISNSIQSKFIEISNLARLAVRNGLSFTGSTGGSISIPKASVFLSTPKVIPTAPIVPQPLPSIKNQIQQPSSFILNKIFNNSENILKIYETIDKLIKIYPQFKFGIEQVIKILDDSKVQFDTNIKNIKSRLDKEIQLIKAIDSTYRKLIYDKSLSLMVLLEFNHIYQVFELKKRLTEKRYWNQLNSELAHNKLKLSLPIIIRGRYFEEFSMRFESKTKVNGCVIHIPSFKLFNSISRVSKLQFNEIHQLLRLNNNIYTSVGKGGNNNKNNNNNNNNFGNKKNVLVRDHVDVTSIETDDIIEIFLKSPPSRISLIQADNISHLKNSYENHLDYVNLMKPILTEEFRAEVENQFTEIKGVSIAEDGSISNLEAIDMNRHIVISSLEELSTTVVAVSFKVKIRELADEVGNSDLLLFKVFDDYQRPTFAIGLTLKSSLLKNNKQTINCKFIMSPSTKVFIEKLYTISTIKPNNNSTTSSIPLFFCKISSYITFHRELEALDNFKNSKLLYPMILDPTIENHQLMVGQKLEIPSMLKTLYTSMLNESQFLAINEAICLRGITLIQGPPGTGKTHTIHTLISVLFAINPNYKIIICAPSHAAVDEVAKRVLRKKLLNRDCKEYLPLMVRIGREENISPEVHQISVFKKDNKARIATIKTANILFSTLSASGSKTVKNFFRPDIVIVDESTQSTESSSLIPLSLGVNKLILVGDPLQLPPTVFSTESCENGLNISLFERLAKVLPVVMLNTQYRMHPHISRFPSNQFYRDKLKDGGNVTSSEYSMMFHKDDRYGPISFFDVVDSIEERGTKSIKNTLEIKMVFTLIKKFVQDHPICSQYSFGIVTPYKLQRKEIEEAKKSLNRPLNIEISTIDGFQGAEKDIIIFSCVRKDNIGFLSDRRRINVGITRAKYGLFIIGNKKLLSKDRTWGPYIEYIDSIKRLTSINSVKISELEDQTIQYDLLHPKGLITNLDSDSDNDYYSDDDDEGDNKIINQEEEEEDDDDEDEDDQDDESSSAAISTSISFNNIKDEKNYPSLLFGIIKELQNLNQVKIDQTILSLKKSLRDNFNSLASQFSLYLKNVLPKERGKSSSYNNEQLIGTNLSKQLLNLVNTIGCSKTNIKNDSFKRLKNLLLDGFATARIQLYGSFVSGLSLNDSDLDVNFITTQKEDKNPLKQVLSYLRKSKLYKIQEKRFDANVPIIRFKDISSNTHFDMCSNSSISYHNSLLLLEYSNVDPRFKQLSLLIKWWAIKKDLNDASQRTFSSFCLVNMVIHFLQQLSPPVLPNLQNPSPSHYDNINSLHYKVNIRLEDHLIRFFSSNSLNKFNSQENKSSIGELFYQFFYYYSSFNYKKYIISIDNSNHLIEKRDYLSYQIKSKFILIDPFIKNKNIATSLGVIGFNRSVLEFNLTENLIHLSSSSPTTFDDIFKENYSLSSNSLYNNFKIKN